MHSPLTLWRILCVQYTAAMNDGVIGVVTDKNAEFYRVNIGAAYVVAWGIPVSLYALC